MIAAGIGEALWDIYPEGRYIGGAISNFVLNIVQLGQEGILISRIGSDDNGNSLLRELKLRGINTDYIQIDDAVPTGYVKVLLDENKVPVFECSEDASYDYIEWDDNFLNIKSKIDTVLFGTFAQKTKQSNAATLNYIKNCSEAVKIFDVNFRWRNKNLPLIVKECIQYTDILKMNEDEFDEIRTIFRNNSGDYFKDAADLVKSCRLDLAVVTLGKWGCLICSQDDIEYCPGFKVDPVDTTGAGDAFIAAFSIKHNEGLKISEIGKFANLVSAFSTTNKGAVPEYNINEIINFELLAKSYNIKSEWSDMISGNYFESGVSRYMY